MNWGPMKIVPISHVPGRGYTLEIQTEHRRLQIYVSEKGRSVESVMLMRKVGKHRWQRSISG